MEDKQKFMLCIIISMKILLPVLPLRPSSVVKGWGGHRRGLGSSSNGDKG